MPIIPSRVPAAVLYLGVPDDKELLPHLKGLFNGVTTHICLREVGTLAELEMLCRAKGITAVVSTNTAILQKLLAIEGNIKDSPSLDNYAGSLFSYKTLEIVFINPLQQLFTVPYGKFIASRFISKVVNPGEWREPTEFKWDVVTAENVERYYALFSTAFAISTDIETLKNPLSIRCIGYCAVFISPDTGAISTLAIVLPMDSLWALAWMRKFNELPPAKIFQNGKYDNAYLLRYNSPVINWLWDTAHLFHSWHSELPKDLAFLNAFFLRKVVYWKDLAETTDLHEYYRYNALDTWATVNVWIEELLQLPDWARRNYVLEFPLVYPCLLAEMTGVIRDQDRLLESRREVDALAEKEITSLRACTGIPDLNPNSPPQIMKVFRALGCADLPGTKEIFMKKAMFRHPLNAHILGKVIKARGHRKIGGTYLRTDDDAKKTGIHAGEGGSKEFHGFWLYTQNPHGTDTARLASGEHHFWCGANIQNVPVKAGPVVKRTVRAPDGFYIAECDLEQAESRDTAHITGDEKMIANVSGTQDFHSLNASAFFGISYVDLYDDTKKKTKNKKVRDISKRTNHGANYNMGAGVLVDTMGLEAIWEAKKLLGLPFNDPLEIAQYLLDQFHKTYPKLRGPKTPFSEDTYYAWVAREIAINQRLVSRAFHHTEYNLRTYDQVKYIEQGDWTRYCFGNPTKNKTDLNAYAAHCPQSLNARTLNEAFMKVFYEIALHNMDFRLHAQIHDSILFSYKQGRDDIPPRVQACMEIPVTVKDISGKYRTFTVPAALKLGKGDVKAIYWSETE